MTARAAKVALGMGVLVLLLLSSQSMSAQVADATLSGTITDASGAGVPEASISAKNLDTSLFTTTQTDSAGLYRLANLRPGNYEISISGQGFATKPVETTLAEGAAVTVNAALAAQEAQPQAPTGNLPNAPSSRKTEPSLEDLGFTPEQAQGNAKEQALLDKRTHMLKIHQRMGLITAAPLIATLATSINAGGRTPAIPTAPCTWFSVPLRRICTSSPPILPSVRHESREPRLAAQFDSTRRWRGFTAPA